MNCNAMNDSMTGSRSAAAYGTEMNQKAGGRR
jgi:hypothetical protein